jgi:8-oxo-dGTP pyrophosphatase MutT (NUDIX family)
MRQVTLLFLRKDDQILLAMKKRGFGVGLWNGLGGKVDASETIVQAAIRECYEEIGVMPKNLKAAGYIQFLEPDNPAFEHRCHIFTTDTWSGNPVESEEMRPEWFSTSKIPYETMWPADSIWLPHVIAGELFAGTIHADIDKVMSHNIKIVPRIQIKEDGSVDQDDRVAMM